MSGLIEWYAQQPDSVIVAQIGAMAVVVTVLGSVLVALRTHASIAKQQRAAEVRKTKQQYYNAFFEAFFRKHLSLSVTPNNAEARLEADTALCAEAGRLPLYASQEFTELIGKSMEGPKEAAEVTTAKMYQLMREDLVTDDYKAFKDLKFPRMMLPGPVAPPPSSS